MRPRSWSSNATMSPRFPLTAEYREAGLFSFEVSAGAEVTRRSTLEFTGAIERWFSWVEIFTRCLSSFSTDAFSVTSLHMPLPLESGRAGGGMGNPVTDGMGGSGRSSHCSQSLSGEGWLTGLCRGDEPKLNVSEL